MQGDYQTAGSLYEQSLALFKEIEDKSGIAISLNAGECGLHAGRLPDSHLSV